MSEKINAQHILVDHEHEANDLLKKLNDGGDFDQLATDFSNALLVKVVVTSVLLEKA